MKVKQIDQFEVYRPLMFSIAYRMLGSAMDAEDIVQEAFLRYRKVDPNTSAIIARASKLRLVKNANCSTIS